MKIRNLYIVGLLAGLLFTSCENYDNFDEPNAMLSGRVVYEGEAVGVRNNGARFELWQDGYELNKSIEVYIAQDGTYSASLFNGEYKMVRIAGAPWEAALQDTLVINVNGGTTYDVPVTPYFTIENASFENQGTTINTSFTVNQVVEETGLQSVNVYFGTKYLTDSNYNASVYHVDLETVTPGTANSIAIDVPENLSDREYVFMRIGVRSNSSNEYYYTPVEKIYL
ncbi:Protein of unknown function [Pustulibacterium marinum]|uniref:DUF3823 domain-containing protein n=1 Tax=Pustulibacterium marinum TaxID=1224947 RepID=A0A1I7I2I3_9FLAO|nr:DUF3823 domain-containing protein [Pustulibacterium marinum]SFU67148.1 Protein of unknown function [Pustulibacterium marinum]